MTAPHAARWVGQYGERYALLTPHPHDAAGVVWSVEIDGDQLLYDGAAIMYPDLDDAMRAAEKHVGAALKWERVA